MAARDGDAMDVASVPKRHNMYNDTSVIADPVSGNADAYISGTGGSNREPEQPFRKNLRETAFFLPQLRTDEAGNIRFQFKMPEELTEWKFMALAHTKDMAFGTLEGRVKTQKELMIFPGLPRFLRQGDDMILTTKISNLGGKDQNGNAKLEILNAVTQKPLNTVFKIEHIITPFTMGSGQSTTASWKIHVPENLFEPVILRISANAGEFTDGEENTLPVISNRIMVTETQPLWVTGNREKKFRIEKLLHSDTSHTLSQYGLTLEFTSNPAWYAILALPYLMDYPYECAEQTFNRYYANALAAHIVHMSPKVEEIFNAWQHSDTSALISNLEKNQELKSALLNQTPWVLEAKSETEQKHRIVQLFETYKLKSSQQTAIRKLYEMRLPSGGFAWFKGNPEPDRYITQYVLTGIGRLKHIGVDALETEIKRITTAGLTFADKQIKKDYEYLKTRYTDMSKQHIDNDQVQYLYMRSFFIEEPVAKEYLEAYKYFLNQAVVYQSSFNNYMRGMIALALYRAGDKNTANAIISSLRELAHHNEESGMYWKQNNSWLWYEAPVEEQALLIECFNEITSNKATVDSMKLWLLKQKQTQNWHTSKATADACYALLLNGSDWLANEPDVMVNLGNVIVKPDVADAQNGTGYFKTRYNSNEVTPEMGNVTVKMKSNDHSTAWGSVYWQYFENLNRISNSATNFVVNKTFYKNTNSNRGTELTSLTSNNELKPGDKVTVRIEIIADRNMDYVHLKDMRAACFEPANVMSGYKYQGGIGYYEATKDASSDFFIAHLQKGKYVFEYPVYVTHAGDFSGGIATLQCMYAPEFNSHSNGIKLHVTAK